MDLVYVNGVFTPRDQATISVFDRGFLFSDGVYELMPVESGQFYTAKEHIQRLLRSCDSIRIPSPHSEDEWLALCNDFMKKNQVDESVTGSIYIQVTRGQQLRRQHYPNETLTPTVVMFWMPMSETPNDLYRQGISAVTVEDKRRGDCSFKAIALLPNILATYEAHDQNANEAIQIRDGFVQEGTMSNIFVVQNGVIITPPLSRHILQGVTRQRVIAAAKKAGIPCEERPIPESDLAACDEIWVTGSRKEIYPVITLNQQAVGSGDVGPVWHQLMDAFNQAKQDHLSGK